MHKQRTNGRSECINNDASDVKQYMVQAFTCKDPSIKPCFFSLSYLKTHAYKMANKANCKLHGRLIRKYENRGRDQNMRQSCSHNCHQYGTQNYVKRNRGKVAKVTHLQDEAKLATYTRARPSDAARNLSAKRPSNAARRP